jgi:hypothetical protein
MALSHNLIKVTGIVGSVFRSRLRAINERHRFRVSVGHMFLFKEIHFSERVFIALSLWTRNRAVPFSILYRYTGSHNCEDFRASK